MPQSGFRGMTQMAKVLESSSPALVTEPFFLKPGYQLR
jgi:hypothetical protein